MGIHSLAWDGTKKVQRISPPWFSSARIVDLKSRHGRFSDKFCSSSNVDMINTSLIDTLLFRHRTIIAD